MLLSFCLPCHVCTFELKVRRPFIPSVGFPRVPGIIGLPNRHVSQAQFSVLAGLPRCKFTAILHFHVIGKNTQISVCTFHNYLEKNNGQESTPLHLFGIFSEFFSARCVFGRSDFIVMYAFLN